MNTTSWKKLTVTVLTIALTIGQMILQPHQMSVEQAATAIAGMVVTVIIGAVYVITQGKFDLTKLQHTPMGANVETVIEKTLQPILEKIEQSSSNAIADNTAPITTPIRAVATKINEDGTCTIRYSDGSSKTV